MWTMEKDQQLAVAALLELAGSALVELSDSNFYWFRVNNKGDCDITLPLFMVFWLG